MSQQLISRNADLKRLRDEGYDVTVKSGHLVLGRIPYVTSHREIRYGTLISELSLSGDVTTAPATHVAYWDGEFPCDHNGSPIEKIRHQSGTQTLGGNLTIQHSFSSKPDGGYKDHYEKMATYISIIANQARAIDPSVTPTHCPAIESESDDSVFAYLDTATSRAGIGAVNDKLKAERIGIIGLGGTGSYVLDLVAKTPVQEIHLFDGDRFSQHNAFRSPGAASLQDLRESPKKVTYFRTQYARMHRRILAHDGFLNGSNVEQLHGLTFVFMCMDDGEAKKPVVAELEAKGIPFIDVGMGLQYTDNQLRGLVRVTTSTAAKRDHVLAHKRIPFTGGGSNEYTRNIQIADLNALNAALAVIKWKKIRGFYADLDREHFSVYTIDGNTLDNEDKA
jgi:hypothetical protein